MFNYGCKNRQRNIIHWRFFVLNAWKIYFWKYTIRGSSKKFKNLLHPCRIISVLSVHVPLVFSFSEDIYKYKHFASSYKTLTIILKLYRSPHVGKRTAGRFINPVNRVLICLTKGAVNPQSTYIYRVQNSVWCLPKYWPPTPSPPGECVPPPPHGGVNILEDARHWIGLLQYNPHTGAPTHQ